MLPGQQALALDAELQQGFDHDQQGHGCGHQANGIALCHWLDPGGYHADRYWIHRPLQGLGRVSKQPAQPKGYQQGWAKALLAQLKLPNAVPERRSPKPPTGVWPPLRRISTFKKVVLKSTVSRKRTPT